MTPSLSSSSLSSYDDDEDSITVYMRHTSPPQSSSISHPTASKTPTTASSKHALGNDGAIPPPNTPTKAEQSQPQPQPPIKRPRGRPPKNVPKPPPIAKHAAYVSPRGLEPVKLVKQDLQAFGFAPAEVRRIAALKEPTTAKGAKAMKGKGWSGEGRTRLGRQRGGEANSLELAGDGSGESEWKNEERTQRGGARVKGEYEPLRLGGVREGKGGMNWVLFDPHLGIPPDRSPPPSFLLAFATFQPGNQRVLEYNVINSSVRTRSAPQVLRAGGKTVLYAATGPRLVDVRSGVGRKRKRGKDEEARGKAGEGDSDVEETSGDGDGIEDNGEI